MAAWRLLRCAHAEGGLQADVSGSVVKWLVENGTSVTPGQVGSCMLLSGCPCCSWFMLATDTFLSGCSLC